MSEEDQFQLVAQLRAKAGEMRSRYNDADDDKERAELDTRESVYDDIADIIETLRNP